jgi:hypothetical protein
VVSDDAITPRDCVCWGLDMLSKPTCREIFDPSGSNEGFLLPTIGRIRPHVTFLESAIPEAA